MGRSWALLLVGLGLLCLGSIVAVTTMLPAGGITLHWSPYLRLAPRPGAAPFPDYPNPTPASKLGELQQRLGLPPNLAPPWLARDLEDENSGRLALRPFGVHRPGLGGIALYLGSWLAFASLGVLALYLFPQRLSRSSQHLSQGWAALGEAGLLGLAGYLFLGVLGALLALTVVGIPLALILTVGASGLSFLALVTAASVLGQQVAAFLGVGGSSPFLWWLAGLLLLFALGILPVVGWLVVALAVVFGFGALLRTRFGGDQPGNPYPSAESPS